MTYVIQKETWAKDKLLRKSHNHKYANKYLCWYLTSNINKWIS